jgi:hypothetical protein
VVWPGGSVVIAPWVCRCDGVYAVTGVENSDLRAPEGEAD